MTDMAQEGFPEDRRAFFKTLGRNLALGITGGGIAWMIQNGRINTCINEFSPCSSCVALKQGCDLPKAEAHRKQEADGRSSQG
ncbi:MAG TPA: hypothetical protein VMU54_01415 [Planctomycetota bacterium]|nr:hypothetical protein [Planctomycetota bacterium]